ncbi:hypothetical protein Salat_1685400 [Sesamum alatum]|uniref:Uncharacterized protein n=1 Tax=Sesamum alatum TaxID=300844 RepID=A0AAE1Y894_9LAMI|nr:hypothetical protein Salat_1685400 [Sesamum alatum]
MAGEVDHPQKTFSVALFSAVILTCLGYLIPLVAVIRALVVDQSKWEAGFMAYASRTISGTCLRKPFAKDFSLGSKWFSTPWFRDIVGVLFISLIEVEVPTDEETLQGASQVADIDFNVPDSILLSVFIMAIATKIVYLVSGLMTVGGIG